MKKEPFLSASLAIVGLLLSSCISAPERDAAELQALPSAYATAHQGSPLSEASVPWWQSFEREDLNRLEGQALESNLDIDQAWSRLRQSEAAARQAGAKLYPQADLNGGSSRVWREGQSSSLSDYSLGLGIAYEIDLWGKIRAGRNAARVQNRVRVEALQSTALTVSAAVAERWVEMIEATQRLRLLNAQLETNTTQLELVELRFKTSQASALDVYQQEQTIARTRSRLPQAQADLQLSKLALNLLLGRAGTEGFDFDPTSAPPLPPLPPTGVPSDLLAWRPDVRAAWFGIEQADWNVAQAQADRLPTVSLSASGSFEEAEFEDLFDDWLARLAANLTAPLLDGGKRKQEVIKQQAVVDEAVAAYRSAVLGAVTEVEQALVGEQRIARELKATRAELELARRTLAEARNRYANGLSTYLNVASALVSVQGLELDEIRLVANKLKTRIALHKALGGGLYASGIK